MRLGIPPVERLRQAERLAGGVLRAIVKASRVAGVTGMWEALSLVYTLVSESRALASTARTQGLLMSLILAVIPALSVYALNLTAGAVAGAGQLLGVRGEAIATSMMETARVIVATAPLITLPATILHRGWMPSTIPPLAATTLAYITLTHNTPVV